MSTVTGKIMAWDDNHATRKLLLDKFNKLNQPKVSGSGVEISADDTGLSGLFENKSENVRNVQESFVPLSKIEGTVENTELKETQNEVFETKKINILTEQRLIDRAVKLYEEKKPMNETQLARLEVWKKSNPEKWEKICR